MQIKRRPVTVVVPGDLHLTKRDQTNFHVAVDLLREVNQLIRPDFVQFIGDNVQDATDEQFALFDELRNSLSVPNQVLVGDHDVCRDANATGFRQFVGETYGSTSLSGFRFVRLNTLDILRLGFSQEQLGWLANEFESAQRADERVIVFQHHYPYKVCEQFSGPGIEQWRELVRCYHPNAIICGHTHYAQIANDGLNVALTVRSIGDPEGGEPGYLIVHIENDDFAVTMRTIADQGPVLLITHPRAVLLATDERHIVQGADEVRVRIWSETVVTVVAGRIDDSIDVELSPCGENTWAGTLPGQELSKGEHQIDVNAHLIDGTRCHSQLNFFVDTTRRFTAVPAASPVVRTTAFC